MYVRLIALRELVSLNEVHTENVALLLAHGFGVLGELELKVAARGL
jgi:hypothetical protein